MVGATSSKSESSEIENFSAGGAFSAAFVRLGAASSVGANTRSSSLSQSAFSSDSSENVYFFLAVKDRHHD